MAFTGVFINLFLNMILIPEYGSEGAAFASLITQLEFLMTQKDAAQATFTRITGKTLFDLIG